MNTAIAFKFRCKDCGLIHLIPYSTFDNNVEEVKIKCPTNFEPWMYPSVYQKKDFSRWCGSLTLYSKYVLKPIVIEK